MTDIKFVVTQIRHILDRCLRWRITPSWSFIKDNSQLRTKNTDYWTNETLRDRSFGLKISSMQLFAFICWIVSCYDLLHISISSILGRRFQQRQLRLANLSHNIWSHMIHSSHWPCEKICRIIDSIVWKLILLQLINSPQHLIASSLQFTHEKVSATTPSRIWAAHQNLLIHLYNDPVHCNGE